MAATAKISISVADPDLLAWARRRSRESGRSLSALFTDAIRLERQMEARAQFLAAEGPEGRATPAEMAAIRAEWIAPAAAAPRPYAARPIAASRSRAAAKRSR